MQLQPALNTTCSATEKSLMRLIHASVERSIGIVTALNSYIGYANATEIAAEAPLSARGVAEIVFERKLMSPGN